MVEIRGVIVSSMYDNYWLQDYIAKGSITPENRVRDQLKAALAAGEDVQLYINSNGGLVFAGSEMLNAVRDFTAAGGNLSIRAGAMAASMASAIIVLSGAKKIEAYKNSKIMFHSATSDVESGGPEQMEDVAKLLRDINADVLNKLVSLDASKKEKFETWFKEGRQGWLTAAEAKEIGLITDIIGEDDTKLVGVSKEAAAALAKHDLDIAAFAVEGDTPSANIVEMVALAEFQALETRLKGLQAAKDGEISALKKEFDSVKQGLTDQVSTLQSENTTLTQSLESVKTEMSTLKTDHEKLNQTLTVTGEQLKAVKEAHAKLTGDTLGQGDSYGSFLEAQKELGHAEARRQYPALYAEYMDRRGK